MVSFIISIDNTYAMVNNFFELFLQDEFVKSSEIVVILDGVSNQNVISFCEQLEESINNFILLKFYFLLI